MFSCFVHRVCAKDIEAIEAPKARERMAEGGRGGLERGADAGTPSRSKTREVVADAVGMGSEWPPAVRQDRRPSTGSGHGELADRLRGDRGRAGERRRAPAAPARLAVRLGVVPAGQHLEVGAEDPASQRVLVPESRSDGSFGATIEAGRVVESTPAVLLGRDGAYAALAA